MPKNIEVLITLTSSFTFFSLGVLVVAHGARAVPLTSLNAHSAKHTPQAPASGTAHSNSRALGSCTHSIRHRTTAADTHVCEWNVCVRTMVFADELTRKVCCPSSVTEREEKHKSSGFQALNRKLLFQLLRVEWAGRNTKKWKCSSWLNLSTVSLLF